MGEGEPAEDHWVQCDACSKWRRVPQGVADAIDDDAEWFCAHNPNPDFSRCDVPQELSNEEIDRAAEPDGEQVEEDGRGAAPKLPAVWQLIRGNVYRHRKRKVQDEDDIMVCHCPPPWRGGDGCGPNCINRMLCIECTEDFCPCENHCNNQMFTKKQYAKLAVRRAGAKGFGLFTDEDLEPGAFLIEYIGEVLEEEEYMRRKGHYIASGQRHYYFMNIGNGEVIDACRMGNQARFINHSCEPNCETQKWNVRGELAIGLFTLRRIRAGEELTFDYNFERYGDKPMRCFCGSDRCRKFIGGTQESTADIAGLGDAEDVTHDPEPVMVREDEMDAAVQAMLDKEVGTTQRGWDAKLLKRLQQLCRAKGIDWSVAGLRAGDLGEAGRTASTQAAALESPSRDGSEDGSRAPGAAGSASAGASHSHAAASPASSGVDASPGAAGGRRPLKAALKQQQQQQQQLKRKRSVGSGEAGAAASKAASAAARKAQRAIAAAERRQVKQAAKRAATDARRAQQAAARRALREAAGMSVDGADEAAATTAAGGARRGSTAGAVDDKYDEDHHDDDGSDSSGQQSEQEPSSDSESDEESSSGEDEDLLPTAAARAPHSKRVRIVPSRSARPPPGPGARAGAAADGGRQRPGARRSFLTLAVTHAGKPLKKRSEVDRRLEQLVHRATWKLREPGQISVIKVLRMFNLCDITPRQLDASTPAGAAAAPPSTPSTPLPPPTQQLISLSRQGSPVRRADDDERSSLLRTGSGMTGSQQQQQQQHSDATTGGAPMSLDGRGDAAVEQDALTGSGSGPGTTAAAAVPGPPALPPHLATLLPPAAAAGAGARGGDAEARERESEARFRARLRARMADLGMLLDVVLASSSEKLRREWVACGVLTQLQATLGRLPLTAEYSGVLVKAVRVLEHLPLGPDDLYQVRSAHGTFADLIRRMASSASDWEVRRRSHQLLKRYAASACSDATLLQLHGIAGPNGRSYLHSLHLHPGQLTRLLGMLAKPGSGGPPCRPARRAEPAGRPPRSGGGGGGGSPGSVTQSGGPPPWDGGGGIHHHHHQQQQQEEEAQLMQGNRPLGRGASSSQLAADGWDVGPLPVPPAAAGGGGGGSSLGGGSRAAGRSSWMQLPLPPQLAAPSPRGGLPPDVGPLPPWQQQQQQLGMRPGERERGGWDRGSSRERSGWDRGGADGELLLPQPPPLPHSSGGGERGSSHAAPGSDRGAAAAAPPTAARSSSRRGGWDEPASTNRPAVPRGGGGHGGVPQCVPAGVEELCAMGLYAYHALTSQGGTGPPRGAAVWLHQPPLSPRGAEAASGGRLSPIIINGRTSRPTSPLRRGGSSGSERLPPAPQMMQQQQQQQLLPPPPIVSSLAAEPGSGWQHAAAGSTGGPSAQQKQQQLPPPPSMSMWDRERRGSTSSLPQQLHQPPPDWWGPGTSTTSADAGVVPVPAPAVPTAAAAATGAAPAAAAAAATAAGPPWPNSWEQPDASFEAFVTEAVRHRLGKYVQHDHPSRISKEDAQQLYRKLKREVVEKEAAAFAERQAAQSFKPIERLKLEGNIKEFVRLSIRRLRAGRATGH